MSAIAMLHADDGYYTHRNFGGSDVRSMVSLANIRQMASSSMVREVV